jgi:uncharacterized protein YyaL (SSP411 family)
MTSPDGAFYTAFDAEVDAKEGGSYLWTREEVESILRNGDAVRFMTTYGVDRGPNFVDPHHGGGAPDQNILYLANGPQHEDDPAIVQMRAQLYEARRQRKQPLLDTKIITSWNALMIRALAHGGLILSEPRYVEAADRAMRFILDQHVNQDGVLIRTSRDGVAKYEGYLDDYAFLVHAMLALDAARPEDGWRVRAAEFAELMYDNFADRRAGGFYFTRRGADDLIIRQKIATDSPLPSGNAVAAMLATELGSIDSARLTIAVFAAMLQQQGESMSAMLQAAMMFVEKHGPIEVEAKRTDERPESLDETAHRVVGIGTRWNGAQQLDVRLTIARPYHIQSHAPPEGLIATSVNVHGGEVEAIEYPPGETYEEEAIVSVRFRQRVDGGVRVTVRYQACDDSACLPPVSKTFEVTPTS